jgi:hypothetical protein
MNLQHDLRPAVTKVQLTYTVTKVQLTYKEATTAGSDYEVGEVRSYTPQKGMGISFTFVEHVSEKTVLGS